MDQMALDSREQRWALLKQSVKLTLTHPIFGVGPGQFTVASKDESVSSGGVAMWRETHNAYTEVSSECGVPGMLLYFSCLVICFRQMSKLKRLTKNSPQFQHLYKLAYCQYLSLLSFAVTSFFSSVAYAFYMPTLLGLTVALYQAAIYELGVEGYNLNPTYRAPLPPSRAGLAATAEVGLSEPAFAGPVRPARRRP